MDFQRTENMGSTDPNLFEGDMILTPEQKAGMWTRLVNQ